VIQAVAALGAAMACFPGVLRSYRIGFNVAGQAGSLQNLLVFQCLCFCEPFFQDRRSFVEKSGNAIRGFSHKPGHGADGFIRGDVLRWSTVENDFIQRLCVHPVSVLFSHTIIDKRGAEALGYSIVFGFEKCKTDLFSGIIIFHYTTNDIELITIAQQFRRIINSKKIFPNL
jgi:hypothetical protein